MREPGKISVSAAIAAMVMLLGGIAWTSGLTMAVIGDRPGWVLSILMIGGLSFMLVGAIFYINLTMTEEEGRISPPPAGQENNCVDDPELDRC